jgi:PAS domain S-box-containing protein
VLGINKRTVEEHVQAAMRKLGAVNRTQAVAIARCEGDIDIARERSAHFNEQPMGPSCAFTVYQLTFEPSRFVRDYTGATTTQNGPPPAKGCGVSDVCSVASHCGSLDLTVAVKAIARRVRLDDRAVLRPRVEMSTEQPPLLSTAPAGRSERRLALAAVLLLLLAFAASVPFARVPLPHVWAFIPIYESMLLTSDLVTAVLLFAQYRVSRSGALFVLACGYAFTALMAVPHALSFPGLFAAGGLLGAGPQTTAWLYMFWHAGFPLAVISYALLKGRPDHTKRGREPGLAGILSGVAAVACAVAALTLLATAGQALLPGIMVNQGYGPAMVFVTTSVWALSVIALVMLWTRRPHAVLDLWLMVVMAAWLCDVALSTVLNAGRFDLGFYAGRIYGLFAATFVLMVLLLESGDLYARLAALLATEQQERRREAEERRRIFETSLDLILVVDRQGNFVRVSPSSLDILGHAPGEMIGRNAVEFVYPNDLESIRGEMRRARRGQFVRNFETRYRHKDGRAVPLSWSGVWSAPEQRHFFIGRDLTELKMNERMKDEFIATVSHELRTPLTALTASLGLLAANTNAPLPGSTGRLVDLAHANSQRLVRLVNDILDIGAIEAGTTIFHFQRAAIRPLIERAVEINRPLVEGFGVRLNLDGACVDVDIRVDPDRLTQAISNLLSNAAKFSPRDSDVVVSITVQDECVRVCVRDHGPGIPDDYKSRIFDKFAQVDATDARQKGGTGLGLSIVKQIMTRLGGEVDFEPAPGGGTIFYLNLPRWDPGLLA